MERIDSFEGKYDFLSNFYPCIIKIAGVRYINAEAAFQAAKTLDMDIRRKISIMMPGKAKREGRRLKLREDWESIKGVEMYKVVLCKFRQNPALATKLIDTGDAYLEEGNTWHDNTWGNCTCPACVNTLGANKLGLILMAVRNELSGKPVN